MDIYSAGQFLDKVPKLSYFEILGLYGAEAYIPFGSPKTGAPAVAPSRSKMPKALHRPALRSISWAGRGEHVRIPAGSETFPHRAAQSSENVKL